MGRLIFNLLNLNNFKVLQMIKLLNTGKMIVVKNSNLNSAEKAKIFTSFSHYFSVQIAQWNTEDKLTIDEKIEAKAFLIFDQKAELKKQMKKEQNDFLQKIENKMINGKTNNKNDTKKAEKISKEYLNALSELYNGNKKYTTNKLDNIFAIKSDSVVEENTVSEDKNKISTSEETVSEDKSEKTLSKKVEKAPKKNKLNIFKLIKEKNLGYEQIRKLDINKEAKCLNNKIIKDEIPMESLSKIETNSQIKKKIPKESSTKKETNSQIKKKIPEESSTKNETNSQIKKKN